MLSSTKSWITELEATLEFMAILLISQGNWGKPELFTPDHMAGYVISQE